MRFLLFVMSMLVSLTVTSVESAVRMYQVAAEDDWALLAERHGLDEWQLRDDINRGRAPEVLLPGDWIRVPAPAYGDNAFLTELSPPPNVQTQKSEQMMLTLAGAMKAAAEDRLDAFVERQTSDLTDDTLLYGTNQLSSLPWISPESWGWDYQLPLFDKEPRFSSRMALPLSPRWKGEAGVDYRDERTTYQLGLNVRQPLSGRWQGQVSPVFDFQDGNAHRRAGLTLSLLHPDWRLGVSRYQALSGWRQGPDGWERPASGQLWFGEGSVPFVPGLTMALSRYRWHGKQLSLQGSGDRYQASSAQQWSLSYAPWEQLLRIKTELRSNNRQQYESRVRLALELPLDFRKEFRPRRTDAGLLDYQPLRHHSVMVLEQSAYKGW